MLVESNPLLGAPSFDREREVRKHIGDFTLFFTGMFPEYVATLPRRGLRLDSFVDYVKAAQGVIPGRRSVQSVRIPERRATVSTAGRGLRVLCVRIKPCEEQARGNEGRAVWRLEAQLR